MLIIGVPASRSLIFSAQARETQHLIEFEKLGFPTGRLTRSLPQPNLHHVAIIWEMGIILSKIIGILY
jgi:hypothetical protein